MRISREINIAGQPALALRDAFKRLSLSIWTSDCLGSRLGLADHEAAKACDELVDDGYLEVQEWNGQRLYSLTTKGNSLALASAAKPISRRRAEGLVAEVLERALVINAEGRYAYGVDRIVAFGSYLSASPDLGDVDLAVELYPKHSHPPAQQAEEQDYCRRVQLEGRRFRSPFDRMLAPRMDVFAALKNKSRYVSIHEASELAQLSPSDTRLIFSANR